MKLRGVPSRELGALSFLSFFVDFFWFRNQKRKEGRKKGKKNKKGEEVVFYNKKCSCLVMATPASTSCAARVLVATVAPSTDTPTCGAAVLSRARSTSREINRVRDSGADGTLLTQLNPILMP